MAERQVAADPGSSGTGQGWTHTRILHLICPLYLGCLLLLLVSSGCATTRSGVELPPLLAQDELVRPYGKMADVRVIRERFGTAYDLKKEDYDWAYEALREEAAKIGADAVIFPEVKLETSSYLMFPTTHIDARGLAIKFR